MLLHLGDTIRHLIVLTHPCETTLLFNLEYDHGDVIEGYIIPDGFSDEPSIAVTCSDGSILTMKCDQEKSVVVQSGRHATGIVGFKINRNNIPSLPMEKHLEIHDAKTGLLIYRRPPVSDPISMKLLRLELSILPMQKFDQFCGNHFQYSISGAERFGHETALQVFHLNRVPSIYISGRLLLRNYEEFLDKGFQVIADIPDPYYEMAARLFILKRLAKGGVPFIGDRDRMLLAAATEYFSPVNLSSERELAQAFKKAPEKVRQVFVSPTTRQLVCSYPEQSISRREVAPAVDALSRFAVVGYGEDNTHFQDAVGELLGLEGHNFPLVPRHSILEHIADKLRTMPITELILEEDLIFDHYVRQAVYPHISINRVNA